jgi:FemAB-related protein (PEP-CTERM system-associated)
MSGAADELWDAFVRRHPQGSFFHLSGWKAVAQSTFGHRPHYLSLGRGEAIEAVLPLIEVRSRLFGHALISNAFCVGGGPLCRTDEAARQLLDKAEALGRALGVDYLELRDTATVGQGWTVRSGLYAGFEAPIARGEDDNLKQIPRKQRAVVRKALGRGMTVTIDRSTGDFFRLYARTMRDHGTPALPQRFFDRLLQVFGQDCEILTVHQDGRPTSSVLSYFFRDRVLPYYTGSRREARDCGANDLMYWALMRRAAERGCTVFDFGRSKVGTGPYAFKCNWGFEPRPISHQYRLLKAASLPEINPTNPRYALFIRAWRRLPIPLATAVSPLLSRSLA